ncbi:MAG: translation initiation factor IF-2 N-terminal domain-containing protein [Thiomicrospira sp.]
MKKEFNWYFPISEDEVNEIWGSGLLTVDANVLLDLYRYHESTRNTLIGSLKDFNGRLWLSNQAAEEFIRNRTGVIVSSEKTFKQAKDEVEKLKNSLESTISQLKGNRIIPDEIADGLIEKINPAIDEALNQITESKSSYPKYLNDDPILEQLMEMFSEAVGPKFSKEEVPELIKEAKNRIENKVPPGYMDDNKDDNQQYGDYFLWRQILDKSKTDGTPIIFVTSERKEDWWEKISGKTIGPRPELLREAYDYTGKRILIYQTDRFLEYSSKRSGNTLDSDAVAEIRAVDMLRADIEHAVELTDHNILKRTENSQEGVLVINLTRPVKNLTGSGFFDPHMNCVPAIEVILESAPDELGEYKLRAGAGTKFNFNLHVISAVRDQLLPVGQYILRYKARCDLPQSDIVTVKEFAEVVGLSSDRLIKQLLEAGVNVKNEEDEMSSAQKLQLLEFLKRGHG